MLLTLALMASLNGLFLAKLVQDFDEVAPKALALKELHPVVSAARDELKLSRLKVPSNRGHEAR